MEPSRMYVRLSRAGPLRRSGLRVLAILLAVGLSGVALAQSPAIPAVPAPPLPSVPPPPAKSHEFEPMLYCLYDGIPYSRGSRLYQGGFAMSCDLVANNNNSLVWQLVR